MRSYKYFSSSALVWAQSLFECGRARLLCILFPDVLILYLKEAISCKSSRALQAISEFPCASVSKRVRNHSYENYFYFHENDVKWNCMQNYIHCLDIESSYHCPLKYVVLLDFNQTYRHSVKCTSYILIITLIVCGCYMGIWREFEQGGFPCRIKKEPRSLFLLTRYLSQIIIHQIFLLTRDWPKRVTWPNIPQLQLGNIREYSQFSKLPLSENCPLHR